MWRPNNLPRLKLYYLNKLGWPVETVKGRPIYNFLRLLIHTRKITTVSPWWTLDMPFMPRPGDLTNTQCSQRSWTVWPPVPVAKTRDVHPYGNISPEKE